MDRYKIYVHTTKSPETTLMQQTSAPLFSLMGKNLIMAQIYSALQPGCRHSDLCCVIKIWKLTPGFKHRVETAV